LYIIVDIEIYLIAVPVVIKVIEVTIIKITKCNYSAQSLQATKCACEEEVGGVQKF
jgi:hypothetical protein